MRSFYALFAGCVVLIALARPAIAAEPGDATGSVVVLDFEDDKQFASVRLAAATRVEVSAEAAEGARAARVVFAAVPDGVRDYPAAVFEGDALRVRDLSRFDAISLQVF